MAPLVWMSRNQRNRPSRNETRAQEFLHHIRRPDIHHVPPAQIYQAIRSARENARDRLRVPRMQRRLILRQPKLATHEKDRIARMY
jgi:hypothetical protein